MARPGIAKKLVEIARKEGAVAICHGATGKGNDQIRFELAIKALAPDIKIIAPWRDDKWQMDSREAEIEYCRAHGIDLPFGTDSSYSRDRNLWHISHEGLELEDPANEPNYDHLLVLGVSPEKAPDEGEYVTMTFEAGVPKSVNGKEMKVSDIIRELNRLGGKHGIGIVDTFESKFLINDVCVTEKKPFCHAGVIRFQGQVLTYVPGQGPCYRCIFEDVPEQGTAMEPSKVGIIGAIAGVIGSVQALEAIKYVLGIGELLTGRMYILDGLAMQTRIAKFPKATPGCICSRTDPESEAYCENKQ